jgi:hypothetical protein
MILSMGCVEDRLEPIVWTRIGQYVDAIVGADGATPQALPCTQTFMVYPMVKTIDTTTDTKMDMANRLFFRLYQCANMLHKTGTRAVEA